MTTKRQKNPKRGVPARAFLEDLDGPLTFGELLESIRESEEMSRKEFAEKLGISPQRLCDYEKGRVFPSPKTAWGYAQLLGYSGAQFAALAVEGSMAASGHFVRVQMTPLKKLDETG